MKHSSGCSACTYAEYVMDHYIMMSEGDKENERCKLIDIEEQHELLTGSISKK